MQEALQFLTLAVLPLFHAYGWDLGLLTTLKGDSIVPEFLAILDEYVARRYPA